MLSARADHQVLGFLGRALSLELSAVQLYSTQARLLAAWGLGEPAEKMRAEAQEELGHADRIIERMLALGVAPNASQLRPVRLGRDLAELLEVDRLFELELVGLYQQATRHCAMAGDHDNRLFFEGLLQEEMHHHDELLAWQESLQAAAQQAAAAAEPQPLSQAMRRRVSSR